MEHKNLTFEIKAVDYEGRTLEGFAAGIGNLDQGGDIIHPGAFRKTLIERGGRIKFLWQHDPTEPIGKLIEAKEQDSGLFVKAIISDTSRGRDALALLKDGAIGEMSIGYDAVKGGTDYSKTADGATVRNLREIKLYEFSLVTFPMNEAARVTALKDNGQPSEGKPWANVPEADWPKMEDCVNQVMDKGKDKETAIAICYSSIVGGKSLAEAFYFHGLDYPDDVKAAMRTEADGQHPAGHYLVVEDATKPSTWHLRVKGPDGKPDHRLMGAAWAALHGGYRGNAYEGPGKTEAIAKLRAMYESEDIPIPGKGGDPISQRKIGRMISAANLAKLKAARDVIDELMGVIEEPEELDTESKSATMESSIDIDGQLTTEYAAGPVKPPTERMLKLIELELSELTNH